MQRLARLRELRELAGLSQEGFSEASGVSRATIADLEAGKRPPRPSTARRLAESLGVDIRDLLEEPTSPKEQASTSPPPAEDEERRERDLDAIAVIHRATKRWEELEETLKAQGPGIAMNAVPFSDLAISAEVLYEEVAAHHRQPPKELDDAKARLDMMTSHVGTLIRQLMRRGGQSKEQQEQLQIFADKWAESSRLHDTKDEAAAKELTRKPEAG